MGYDPMADMLASLRARIAEARPEPMFLVTDPAAFTTTRLCILCWQPTPHADRSACNGAWWETTGREMVGIIRERLLARAARNWDANGSPVEE